MATDNTKRSAAAYNLLTDDWKVLSSIFDLLLDEQAFCIATTTTSTNTNTIKTVDRDHGDDAGDAGDADRPADDDDDDRVDAAEKIVHFMQPNELKKLIDLKIAEDQTHSADEILSICRTIIKYSVKTNHPRFHNQLFGQLDPYGLAGAWISEALNTSAYTFEVAPVFSLIETEIIRWACQLAGYGGSAAATDGHDDVDGDRTVDDDDARCAGDGIFSPGGSISNMYGLVLARYKRCPQVKTHGLYGLAPLVLFTSEEAHYSLLKAAHWLGFGADNCVVVRTNERGQMSANELSMQIARVRADGREPFFVNATAGTTVLGAFDDLRALADICERERLWLHVDACLGGSLLLSRTSRHLLAGLERAHSFAWNPHKTLGAPLQCSLFVTRERQLLAQCNSLQVHYLFQQDKFYDVRYDTGNKSVQCGRKVDAFKFWLMLKARGSAGCGRLVDHALSMAQRLVQLLRARHNRFRLVLAEFEYTNVCFWYIPLALRGREETAAWQQQLYAVAPRVKELMIRDGSMMIGYCPLAYRDLGNFFRMVLTCFPPIEERELVRLLDEIERLGELV